MKTLEEVRQEMLAKAMGRPLAKYSLKDADGRIVVSSNAPSQHAFTDPKDEAYAESHYKLSERFKRDDGVIIKYWKLEPSPQGYFHSADGNYYLTTELRNLMTNLSKSVTNKKLEESAMLESLTLISMFSSRTLLCSQRLRQRDLN